VSSFSELSDEPDLAVIARRRRIRTRADPFIGITLLLVLSDVELDLRLATPAPTGIEIHAIVVGSRLRIVARPEWRLDGEPRTDAPLLRVITTTRFGRVNIDR
jgi:hypothetical protein